MYRHPHTGRRPSGNLCMPVEFHHTRYITLVSQRRDSHFEGNMSQRYVPESSSFDISHRLRLSEHESSLFYERVEWLLVNRGLESSRWD